MIRRDTLVQESPHSGTGITTSPPDRFYHFASRFVNELESADARYGYGKPAPPAFQIRIERRLIPIR